MATDPQIGTPRPFDAKTIEHLIGLMAEHELSEISLQEGDQRIRLRKGSTAPVFAAPPPYPAAPQTALAPSHAPNAGSAAPTPPAKKLHEIKSIMVGTFYSRPKPDKDDYVKAGMAIKPETTVCMIEAMKIFNEIKAECSGVLVEMCVKNGDTVDFGTVLYRVDPGN